MDMEPQKELRTERQTVKETHGQGAPGSGYGGKLIAGLGAAVVVLGVAFGMMGGGGATPKASDSLTPQQIDGRAQQFAAMKAAGPLLLAPVPQEQVEKAIVSLKLPPEQEKAIRRDFADGEIRFVTIGLFDDASEDGDVVALSAGGMQVEVPLMHGMNFTVIPAPAKGPLNVTVTGVYDGGGGITVSGVGSQGQIPLPHMAVGQSHTFQAN